MGSGAAHVTLALLQGPTKALVSSVICGGVGATLLAASPYSAACITFRQAYDDDVFQVRLDSGQVPCSISRARALPPPPSDKSPHRRPPFRPFRTSPLLA